MAPGVGVAVILKHQRRVLLGLRQRSGEPECWQLPGGWMASGETPEDAVNRQLQRALGVTVSRIDFVGVSNNCFSEKQHSVSLYFEADWPEQAVISQQSPHVCSRWEWFDWQNLPENVFLPLDLFHRTAYNPFKRTKDSAFIAF